MKKGQIILLNGLSSSGKTSIAKVIQEKASEHFYHITNDMFVELEVEMLSKKHIEETGAYTKEYMAESCVLMYHFAKIMADRGINVIIETMMCETDGFTVKYKKSNYDIMQDILSDSNIFMVDIFCSLEECRRRNIVRGNRGENQSDLQDKMINKTIKYTFTVDSTNDSAEECADKILHELYRSK